MPALTVSDYQGFDHGMEEKKKKDQLNLRLSQDKTNCRLPSLMCTFSVALEIQLATLGQWRRELSLAPKKSFVSIPTY